MRPEHRVWTAGRTSPLSQLVDMPLLVQKDWTELPLEYPGHADLDNQAVTYLMIDPQSGLAPKRLAEKDVSSNILYLPLMR